MATPEQTDATTMSRWWLLPAALLVFGGLASILLQVFVLPGPVEPSDWRAPAEWVVEHASDADLVRIHPAWNADPLVHLGELGDQISRQTHPVYEDLHDAERVLVLSETGRIDEALARLPFPARQVERQGFGPVTVLAVSVPEDYQPIAWEALEHVADAEIARVDGEKVEQCRNWSKREQRWYCGRRDRWIYVGETIQEVGEDPRACIWAHPPPGNQWVRVTFPDVELQQTLRVRGGLSLRAVRSDRGTPVEMRVTVGEKTVHRTIPAMESSWQAVEVPTGQMAGQRADVTVEVRSPEVFDRFFCFNAWTVGATE